MQAPFLKKMGDSFKSKGGPGKVLFDAVSKGATKDGVIAALEDCETPEDLAYTNSEGCAAPRVCAILRAPSPTLAPPSPQVHGADAAAREPRLAEALRRASAQFCAQLR